MIDNSFTREIERWLAIPTPTASQIVSGAELLLRIDRNRALYQNIVRKPLRLESKLRYELNKHLRYRRDGLTLQQVRTQDTAVMNDVQQLTAGPAPEQQPARHGGKRPDHDQLPAAIQKLWDDNAERWKRMKETYNTLLMLSQPCDRYEGVKALSEAYQAYRRDMAAYDSYKAGDDAKQPESAPAALTPAAASSARAYVSKRLARLEQLMADGKDDSDEAATLREKIAERVDLISSNGIKITSETLARLDNAGVEYAPIYNDTGHESDE